MYVRGVRLFQGRRLGAAAGVGRRWADWVEQFALLGETLRCHATGPPERAARALVLCQVVAQPTL